MKTMRTVLGLFTVGLIAFAGCSSDSDGDENEGGGSASGSATGTGTGTGSGTTTGTTTGTETGTATGTGADTNNSCAEAETLVPNNNLFEGSGVIQEPGDSDYFTVDLVAGDWIAIFTEANPDDDPDMIDTVVTLYDAAGVEQLAEADDSTPRLNTDSELYYRVITDGTYCVRVWEFGDWDPNGTPQGDPTFAYDIGVATLPFANLDAFNGDIEPNDTSGAPQTGLSYNVVDSTLGNPMNFTNIAGALEPGSDVDVYEFVVPASSLTFSMDFTPSGVTGYGSTKGPGLVSLLDTDGTTVIAQLDYQNGDPRGLSSVPVAAGTYFVQVERPDTNVGANDFYFLKSNTWDATNPPEVEPNDTDATATATEPQDPGVDGTISHFIGGTIPAGDVDWWSLDLVTGDSVSVICTSARAGSGARDVEFAIMSDPNDANPKAEVESLSADVWWSDLGQNPSQAAYTATSTGPHYFRITAGTQSAVTSSHYLCGIHATP